MDAEGIKSVLQAKSGVVTNFKLEWDAFRFLLFDKMFAMLGLDKQQEPILTLKLPPQEGVWYREKYASITEGYYMNKVHWISVRYDLASRDSLMGPMEKSYTGFLCMLIKKQQRLIVGKAQYTQFYDIPLPGISFQLLIVYVFYMYECSYSMPIYIGGFLLFGVYMDMFVNAIQRLEKHVCIRKRHRQ